ncbi:MAG: enoyl-CoA hydratase/isomerase family protein [Pararhizobium sp.]
MSVGVSSQDILIRIEGRVGRVTLDRPKSLNALTYAMATALDAALRRWAADPAVSMVVIEGAGERAFCAGGDIQDLYETGCSGDFAYGRRFWADEYRLNALIVGYPKPYVALMDGIVMGGGVGISAHGSCRIVTERTVLAMPECGIGLIPDVGGSWLLARAPGHLGDYAGLTGARLGPADAIGCGFADLFVRSERLADLLQALVETGRPDVVADFAAPPPDGDLIGRRHDIDRTFGAADLADIVRALEDEAAEWAEKAVAALRRASPLSLACAFEVIRRGRGLTAIGQALSLEYRFASRCMEHGDFLEGVRAAIIDKDRRPRWRHRSIEDVTREHVAAMLGPAEGGDIEFEGGLS